MKTFKTIVIALILFVAGTAGAQVSVNVNIGTPPLWGPVGYSDVQYYYLPDVEAYYDVRSTMFIYNVGGTWVHRTYLPRRYRGYDLYGGYKVVLVDYRGNAPYVHYREHKVKYAKGYHGPAQRSIGARPEHYKAVAKPSHNSRPDNSGNRSNVKKGAQDNRDVKNNQGRSKGHGKKR